MSFETKSYSGPITHYSDYALSGRASKHAKIWQHDYTANASPYGRSNWFDIGGEKHGSGSLRITRNLYLYVGKNV